MWLIRLERVAAAVRAFLDSCVVHGVMMLTSELTTAGVALSTVEAICYVASCQVRKSSQRTEALGGSDTSESRMS